MAKLTEIDAFLDKTLELSKFKDFSNNGVQIENEVEIQRVLCSVDGSLAAMREAKKRGAQLILCHHGISWGDSLKRISGLNYKLISYAIKHDIALYAAHLPLDAHPTLGNNAQLARILALQNITPAFDYHGNTIGVVGELPQAVSFDEFVEAVRKSVSSRLQTVAFGSKTVRKVGIVSGGAAEDVEQAFALGCDVFLTGEPGLIGYTQAENIGMNTIFAGHYATERFGVQALGKLLAEKFSLEVSFADFDIPF